MLFTARHSQVSSHCPVKYRIGLSNEFYMLLCKLDLAGIKSWFSPWIRPLYWFVSEPLGQSDLKNRVSWYLHRSSFLVGSRLQWPGLRPCSHVLESNIGRPTALLCPWAVKRIEQALRVEKDWKKAWRLLPCSRNPYRCLLCMSINESSLNDLVLGYVPPNALFTPLLTGGKLS